MFKRLVFITVFAASMAHGQERAFSLSAPDAVVETGFLKHLLPRFSLKTSVRVRLANEDADAVIGAQGVPVFRQGDTLWHLSESDNAYAATFLDWIRSDVGKRTIEAFAPEGEAIFSADVGAAQQVQKVAVTGDAALGEAVSLQKCGRCHVIGEANRMKAIGSTPSFALMRTFTDWQDRFMTFYLLRPHPAFTQVPDITEPFPEHLPSPIAPIEVTWAQIEAITAFVASITPADLGAPIQTQ